MNKNKFLSAVLPGALLAFGIMLASCPGQKIYEQNDQLPKLISLKIKINNTEIKVNDLGKPDKKPAKTQAGSVTLYTKEEDQNFVNAQAVTPLTESEAVKAEFGAAPLTEVPPENYGEAAPAVFTDGDCLWVKLTDSKNNVSAYYAIKIEVKYNPVDVFAIKKYPPSREFTLDGWNSAGDAQTLTVEMEEDYTGYQYQWYSNNIPLNSGGRAIEGATQASYKPVITKVDTYYYYATVTLLETVTTPPVMIRIVNTVQPAPTEFRIGDTRLNYVRGVGGTGSFMFRTNTGDASPDADEKYIDLLMGELGANILRIMVQDDYTNYITNSVQSKNSDQFYHNARDNFFPVIRKANEYGGYVFANAWTAPAGMKTSGKLDGGNLTESGPNYVDYAEHLRGFLKWLNTNRAPIFALGILNEPDFGGGANYEGMGMSAEVTRDWFRTVGNFTTQRVTNRASAGTTSSIFADDIIPGYGGGGATHHVLAMSGDSMGDVKAYMNPQIASTGTSGANNKIELMGRHYYAEPGRYTDAAGPASGAWKDRPQMGYTGPYEAESLAASPQMYAPGSAAGSIKREIWQTEHDFNFHNKSTEPPASNVQNYWNAAFAALNDIDWALRVNGESVFCWWYSSSFSGFVTSYQPAGFPPYTISPRGRAFAHYARYVNETWFLPITRTRGTIDFNTTGVTSVGFDAGSTDPKISAFEDVNGKFISVVMYAPSRSTSGGAISNSFGAGGTNGNDDPTRGSKNVGRVAVVLPDGFVASGAGAIRSYGHTVADNKDWDDIPAGSPRYWIDEPVLLSLDGKTLEVNLPGGNIISIMVKGEWTPEYLAANPRQFEQRVRPYKVK